MRSSVRSTGRRWARLAPRAAAATAGRTARRSRRQWHRRTTMVDFKVDPKRTALVNVDMQNCFIENSPVAAPKGPELLGKVNKLADACRDSGVTVIHTVHVVRADGSNIGVMGEIIPAVKDGVINEGSESAAL